MGNQLDANGIGGREETALERADRNMIELTGESRVVITGIQVLFAFLLIVPFNTGFSGIGPFERGVYFFTLVCAALAAICTIAPSARHRLLFRSDDKRNVVSQANRLVIAGLVSSRSRCAAACCSWRRSCSAWRWACRQRRSRPSPSRLCGSRCRSGAGAS